MGNAKPTLGYASRTEAALALQAQGKTRQQIATDIGISADTVSALISCANRPRAIRPSEEMGRTVVVAVDALDALKPHAERRSLSVNALVRRIVETVVDEGMVDAVLDDGIQAT